MIDRRKTHVCGVCVIVFLCVTQDACVSPVTDFDSATNERSRRSSDRSVRQYKKRLTMVSLLVPWMDLYWYSRVSDTNASKNCRRNVVWYYTSACRRTMCETERIIRRTLLLKYSVVDVPRSAADWALQNNNDDDDDDDDDDDKCLIIGGRFFVISFFL